MASFDDLIREANGLSTTKEKDREKKKSFSELIQTANAERMNREVSRVDSKYIKSFVDTANQFLSSAESDYGKITADNAEAYNRNRRAQYDGLKEQRQVLGAWLDTNKGSLDENTYRELSDVLSGFDEDSKYVMDMFSSAVTQPPQTTLPATQAEVDLQNKIQKQYGWINQSADFGEKSANRDFGNPTLQEYDDYYLKQYGGQRYSPETKEIEYIDAPAVWKDPGPEPVIRDKLGFYHQIKNADATGYVFTVGTTGDSFFAVQNMAEDGAWDQLTEDEINNYYYLMNSAGVKSAEKYLYDMTVELNRRRSKKKAVELQEKYESANGWEKAGMNALSVPANLLGGVVAAVDGAARMVTGTETNPYSNAYGLQDYASQVRSMTAQEIDEKTGVKIPVLNFTLGDAYQSGMSMADSWLAAAVGGKLGGVLLAGNAATSEAKRLYEMGATEEQIRAGSIAAGLTEMICETVSIGKLIDMKDAKTVGQFIKNALIQGGVEASEEATTELANTVSNAIIMTDKSDWAQMVEEKGGSEGLALLEVLRNTTNAAIGGFISGAGSGGGVSAIKGMAGSAVQRSDGQRINQSGATETLQQLALEMAEKNAGGMGKLLQRQAGKVSKNASAGRVGALYSTMQMADSAQLQEQAKYQLIEQGFSEKKAGKIAEAMVLQASNSAMTHEQSRLLDSLSDNEGVQKIYDTVAQYEGSVDQQLAQRTLAVKLKAALVKDGMSETEADALVTAVTQNAEQAQDLPADLQMDDQPAAQRYEQPQSAEGQVLYEDQPVQLGKVKTAGNGSMIVELADGASVDAGKLSFPDQGQQELYQTVAKIADNAGTANMLLTGFRNGNASARIYARAVEQAFFYGRHQIPLAQLQAESPYAQALTAQQLEEAYALGRMAGEKATAQRQAEVQASNKRQTSKKGRLHFEGDRGKLTERQKVSLQTCEVIAKTLGIDVHVFESQRGKNGKRIGDQGWYDPSDGSIHIDLYAGQNGEGVMVFTLSHELVHFIKDWSPAKFRKLAGFLAEQYGKKGVSVHDLVLEQQAKAKEAGRKLSFEQAYEEWVADSMETMLTDGTIVAKLSQLQATDKGLAQKIREFINGFVDRLKNAYKGVSAQTKEGQIVSEMVDAAQQLQDLLADALIDAGNTYRSTEKNTTDDGGVRYQIRQAAGKYYVQAERQVITGDDPSQWGKQIEKYINEQIRKEQDIAIPTADGHLLLLTARSAYKLKDLHLSSIQKKVEKILSDEQYALKGRAATHIDELIQVARFNGYKPDLDGKHENDIGEDGFNYFEAFFRDFDGKYYRVPLSAGINANEETVYSIGEIRQRSFPADRGSSSQKEALKNGRKASTDIIYTSTAKSQEIKTAVQIAYEKALGKKDSSDEKMKSARMDDGVSPRELLLNTVEGMVANDAEYKMLQQYRRKIQELNATEEKVERLGQELRKLYFAESGRDYELIDKLEAQRKEALAKLNRYDSQLINLENTKPIRAIVERMKQAAYQRGYQKARDYYREKADAREEHLKQHYQESRRNAVERHDKAQIRQQIRRAVRDLHKLNESAPRDRRTKEELQEFTKSAARTADIVFLDRYSDRDMIRNGVGNELSDELEKVFQHCQELLKQIDEYPSQSRFLPKNATVRDEVEEQLNRELAKNMKILRDAGVFESEFKRIKKIDGDKVMNDMISSYKKLQGTKSTYLANAYQEEVWNQLNSIKESVGTKRVSDMTLDELGEVYRAYTMVLHVIREANSTFSLEHKTRVSELGGSIVTEMHDLHEAGRKNKKVSGALRKLQEMGWQDLTPVYAFRALGSEEMMKLNKSLRGGEQTTARDIDEAKSFWQKNVEKHGVRNWSMSERQKFVDSNGNTFSLSLGQLLSLYALSKREQAVKHLEIGGLKLDTSELYVETLKDKFIPEYLKHAERHVLKKDDIRKICEKGLTAEQRAFVDATQTYLSEVLGEKGNEVSMKLFGIKLFKEKVYFPIRVANNERYVSTELIDQNKLKNSGFTKEPDPEAGNALILSDYSSVWTSHINKMALYHGMTLPMEDLDRVINYGRGLKKDADGNILKDEKGNDLYEYSDDSVSIAMEKVFGEHPENYIRELMKQLNGGVRSDPAEKGALKWMSKFKKAAVVLSLSVWIQQHTSIHRAMAHIDFKYFWHVPKLGKTRKEQVEEMKKYCPVAIIKEMGGFNVGMGSSVHDYITGRDLRDVDGKLGTVKRWIKKSDEWMGWLPARADENTWMRIWIAVKRETRDKHPSLGIGSDTFYKIAAERFDEVISLTQVYDSTLSKSAWMRSNGGLAKMVTQFAAEPTLALNMAIDAGIQQSRTGKLQLRTAAALMASIIANSLCSALIYAMRDDDEDETFLEKYSAAFGTELMDGLNPATYIPFVRDVWSLLQGYDIGRSDMEVFAGISDSIKKVIKTYQKEDVTEKELWSAWAGVMDYGTAAFGIPVKNVRREINGLINTWKTLHKDFTERDTTALSIKDARQGAFLSTAPIVGLIFSEPKGKRLVDAIQAGDQEYERRLRGSYKTETASNNAITNEIVERFKNGQMSEADAIAFLMKHAGKDKEKAENKVAAWKFDQKYGRKALEEESWKVKYSNLERYGISLEVYQDYCNRKQDTKAKDVLVIHSLPLTRRQKDALYLSAGYAESTIDEAPWH